MSLFPVSSQAMTAATQSSAQEDEEEIECQIDLNNYIFLIPTISAIALGLIFVPHFGLGLAVGAGVLVIGLIGENILTACGVIEDVKEKNSKYGRLVRSMLLEVSLFAPIAEESMYRGCLQPFSSRAIQVLVPATAATVLGTSFSIATAVSIAVSNILFGAVHLVNPHKAAYKQALSASVGGVAFGVLAAQFGLGAAFAAHIANNTLIAIVLGLKPNKGPSVPTHPHLEVKKATSLPV